MAKHNLKLSETANSIALDVKNLTLGSSAFANMLSNLVKKGSASVLAAGSRKFSPGLGQTTLFPPCWGTAWR